MEFQEYPKALYQNADVYRVVASADEEAGARAEGFMDHAQLDSEREAEYVEDKEDDKADKAALVEQAKALGIDANMRWGVKKLQDAIASAGQ